MSDPLEHLDWTPEMDFEALIPFCRVALVSLPPDVLAKVAAHPGLSLQVNPDGWHSVVNAEAGWLFDVSHESFFTAANGIATFRLLQEDGTLGELVVQDL